MIPRLILDGLRRRWWQISFLAFQIWSMANIFTGKAWFDAVSDSMSLSVFIAAAATLWFESREFALLPVSRRTLWSARWWLAVPLTALVVTGALQIALRLNVPGTWTWTSAALAFAYSAVYAGAVFAINATPFGRRGLEPATAKSIRLWVSPFLVMTVAPLVFGRYLPRRFEDIGPIGIGFVLATAAAAIYGYRHQPPLLARPSLRSARTPAPAPAPPPPGDPLYDPAEQAARAARHRQLPLWVRALLYVLGIGPAAEKTSIADRLSGARLLLWLESRKDFYAYIALLVFAVFTWSIGFFTGDPDRPAFTYFYREVGLLPFTHAPGPIMDVMVLGAFSFFASMSFRGRMNMRVLRALPFSTSGLIKLVMSIGLVSAGVVWLVLMVVQLLVAHAIPVSPRLDVLLAAAAIMTFAHAVRIALEGIPAPPPIQQVIAVTLPCSLWYAANRWPAVSPGVSIAASSVLILSASYAVLFFAITRSRRLYLARPASAF